MITRRGKRLIIQRRVPARYGQVDSRTFVKMSLGTDSLELAEAKAPLIWQQLVEGWEGKLAGRTADAEKAFEAAQGLAGRRGFRYLPAARVAELPLEEIVARVEAVKAAPGALLHKALADRTSPFPGHIYPTVFVTGMPSAV